MPILDVFLHAGAFGSSTPGMDIFSNASEVWATVSPALNVLCNTGDREAADACAVGFGMQHSFIHVPSEVLRCCTDRHRLMICLQNRAIVERFVEAMFLQKKCAMKMEVQVARSRRFKYPQSLRSLPRNYPTEE